MRNEKASRVTKKNASSITSRGAAAGQPARGLSMEVLETRIMLAANRTVAEMTPFSRVAYSGEIVGPTVGLRPIASPMAQLAFAAADAASLPAATVTASGGTTAYSVGAAATVIDAAVTVVAPNGEVYDSASIAITSGYNTGEDILDLTGIAGVTDTFDASTGTLELTWSGTKSAAQVQAMFRAVTYRNTQSPQTTIEARQIKFTVGAGTSAAKVVQPDYLVDSDIRTAVNSVFNVIQGIGTKIQALAGTPGSGDTTLVPYTNYTVTDLLYPNSEDLDSNGNPVAAWSTSVQPQQIGGYLQLKTPVANYFTSAAGTSSRCRHAPRPWRAPRRPESDGDPSRRSGPRPGCSPSRCRTRSRGSDRAR